MVDEDHKGASLSFLLKEDKDTATLAQSSQNLERDDARLEALRRSIDLKIDAQGRWWHQGDQFNHERLISLFNRGLDWHPESQEAILRVAQRWCYVKCDQTPFLILKVFPHQNSLWVKLNTEEKFELTNLSIRGDVLFAQLRPDRLARMSRLAQAQCVDWLDHDTQTQQISSVSNDVNREQTTTYCLKWRDKIWPIANS